MAIFRRCRVSKIVTVFVLLMLCGGILEVIIYSMNRTIVRILELFDRKQILNENALRHLPKYDVILSAYMNSGSTYTGKILGFRKDAFYFYEPLLRLTLWGYYKSNFTVCSIRSNICGETTVDAMNQIKPIAGRNKNDPQLLNDKDIINMSVTPLQVAQRIIHHVLRCRLLRIQNLIQPGVTDNIKFSGHSWNTYRYCISRGKPFEHCIEVLQTTACQTAKHKVTKVLRLSLGMLEDILGTFPKVKGVHLFRDPRAIIHSRLETHGYPLEKTTSSNGIKSTARSLCKKMMSDLEEGKRLMKIFPNRFRFVHYEDIYTRDSSLIEMHTYLGMSISKGMLYNARQPHTNNGSNRKRSARSERRKNNAFWWRRYMSWDTIRIVDSECSALYPKLGYPFIVDQHVQEYYNKSLILQNLTFSFV